MFSSQNNTSGVLLPIYADGRTVFRLKDIALLTGETDFISLNKKLNYYVKTRKLQNPRKGVYTKSSYDPLEMVCTLFTPSYISLEYVLQKSGIIFQYDSRITAVSYLSRETEIENQIYLYRKIKGEILGNLSGIQSLDKQINIASPERAFLDMLYLSPDFFFDNLNPLNISIIISLLPQYYSKALTKRVNKILNL